MVLKALLVIAVATSVPFAAFGPYSIYEIIGGSKRRLAALREAEGGLLSILGGGTTEQLVRFVAAPWIHLGALWGSGRRVQSPWDIQVAYDDVAEGQYALCIGLHSSADCERASQPCWSDQTKTCLYGSLRSEPPAINPRAAPPIALDTPRPAPAVTQAPMATSNSATPTQAQPVAQASDTRVSPAATPAPVATSRIEPPTLVQKLTPAPSPIQAPPEKEETAATDPQQPNPSTAQPSAPSHHDGPLTFVELAHSHAGEEVRVAVVPIFTIVGASGPAEVSVQPCDPKDPSLTQAGTSKYTVTVKDVPREVAGILKQRFDGETTSHRTWTCSEFEVRITRPATAAIPTVEASFISSRTGTSRPYSVDLLGGD